MDNEPKNRFLNSQVVNNYRQIYESFGHVFRPRKAPKRKREHRNRCDGCHGAVYRLSLEELLSFNPESYIASIEPTVPFTHRPSVHRHRSLHGIETRSSKGKGEYDPDDPRRPTGIGSYNDSGTEEDGSQFGYGQDVSSQQERYRYVLPKEAQDSESSEPLNYNSYESWSGKFEWTDMVHKINNEIFGNKSFRPNQLEVINCILSGRDTFVVIPTGGGKSLCFQLPAVYDGLTGNNGVTVVVMPLVALIQDQMKRLTALKIQCHALVGELSWEDRKSIFGDINDGSCSSSILFVTPEGIATSKALLNSFKNLEQQGRLSRFIVDEAHCVSVWGNDFRPDYKEMGLLKHEFPSVPVCAFTATATEKVINDVSRQLRLRSPTIFNSSFNRPNLRYEVVEKDRNTDRAIEQLIQLVVSRFSGQCGIIYCLSCMEVEKVAEALAKYLTVAPYHAQMQMSMRNLYYKEWISGRVKVMVATIAFGMGIDKGDVRFVVHFSMPKSIENYFQESGRAGRDGLPATCIIYYSFHDYQRLLLLVNRPGANVKPENNDVNICNILSILEYCQSSFLCRRKFLLSYFGETFDSKCDVPCDTCSSDRSQRYLSRNCQQEVLMICEGMMYYKRDASKQTINFTLVNLHKLLLGKAPMNHQLNGFLKNKGYSSDMAMWLLKYMIIYQLLVERIVPVAGKNFTTFYIGVNQQYRSYLHSVTSLKFPAESPPAPKRELKSAVAPKKITKPKVDAVSKEAKKEPKKETKKDAKKETNQVTKTANKKQTSEKKQVKRKEQTKKVAGKKEPLIKKRETTAAGAVTNVNKRVKKIND